MIPHLTQSGLWPLVAFFFAAVLVPLVHRRSPRFPASLWSGIPLLAFVYFLSQAIHFNPASPARKQIAWAPELGLNVDLWNSPAGLLLALLVTGMGSLIFLYAAAYLKDSDRLGRFLGTLFAFAGAMVGLTIAENLILLFIFWELTSITSYLLIGHFHEKEESRKSALDALLITAGGGLALLAGIIMLGEISGTYLLSELVPLREMIISHSLYPAVFLCIFIGAATKSAQFPFHFWLPGAMAAPAPVSAYLHSATMVKAGVFLLFLLRPVLGGTDLWHYTLLGFGAATMTWGALVAMVQTDLKRLLAFSTVSALGTLVMLIGIGHTLAIKAAVLFFIVHALYKGALFMVAGAIEKGTGTRDVKQLRGLLKSFPLLGIAAVAAAFSMSGLPPFVGFIAKELLYEVKLETPPIGHILLVCGIVANAANIVVALKVGVQPFLGRSELGEIKSDKPRKTGFWLGPLVLGCMSLAFGLFPGTLLGKPINAIIGQITAQNVTVKLKLWHGFNLVLLLSAVTLVIGILLFLNRRIWWQWAEALRQRVGWNGANTFRSGLAAFLRFAGLITRRIQSGKLSNYLSTIFLTAMLLLGAAWLQSGYVPELPAQTDFRIEVFGLSLLLITSGIALTRSTKRMTSVLLLGAIGFSIAALYAMYGAPDLAITQILVETLTLLLFSLAIYGLPGIQSNAMTALAGKRALIVSLLVGIGFAALTLKAFDVQITDAVSAQMAERSLSEAYGKNVVNVILVDFRALDTLGEVAVLIIAALGVFAMLGTEPRPLDELPDRSPVMSACARYIAPFMLIFSIFLLLRGHNEPGGGFIGGLVAAMASIFLHLAKPSTALRMYRLSPEWLMILGLSFAAGSGLLAFTSDHPFLTAVWGGQVTLPPVGKIKFGTPLIFDIGVYLGVAGVVLLLYRTLESWHMRNEYRSHQGGIG